MCEVTGGGKCPHQQGEPGGALLASHNTVEANEEQRGQHVCEQVVELCGYISSAKNAEPPTHQNHCKWRVLVEFVEHGGREGHLPRRAIPGSHVLGHSAVDEAVVKHTFGQQPWRHY